MRKGAMLVRGAIVAMLVAIVALSGCAGTGQIDSATAAKKKNDAYISQVNETMMKLDEDLDSFNEAVSRGDIVNMRSQADNAFKALDELAEIEAPEDLADIKKKYLEGCDKLREALNEYIDLYAEAASKTKDFDWSKYDEKIKSIQKLYDEGVSALEEADKQSVEQP